MSLDEVIGTVFKPGFTQANRLLMLHTPLGENKLVAETLQGWESIDDGGFRLELTALSDDAHIPLKSLVGQPVRLDLQTQQSRSELRPFHGHITEMDYVASNGGLARYRFVIEPWLAFLHWRVDSYLFQDKTVFDIVDSVLRDYQGQGKLNPKWRWDVLERDRYPRRGITTQYGESDFAFIRRLLAEEGLFYWFEHEAGEGDDFGSHTLVIADHNGAFHPNAQESIRFQRSDATEREDTLQQWHGRSRLETNSLSMRSWDYQTCTVRTVSMQTAKAAQQPFILHSEDDPGAYAWENRAQGERRLANAIAALEIRQEQFDGGSTVRTLAPATTFTLSGHYAHEKEREQDRRFLVLKVEHSARNNLDEDLQRAVREHLDAADDGFATPVTLRNDWRQDQAPGQANNEAEVPHYRNRLLAVRAKLTYRPQTRDRHGRLLYPKPTAPGAQTAIVIGVGSPIHTERGHRVKVQFHWQRGSNSSARAEHPSGEDNAPANAALGAWLRVATAVAGNNWGQVAPGRVGQEALVRHINGDIDRPVIIGFLYTGVGETDAQHNRQGQGSAGATGNAPAWFAGEAGEHGHNAVYSGIKTQQLDTSQSGTGGYNQLVFDDTPGQSRLGLSTTQAASRVHLGHLKNQDDNRRGSDRGHGAELATKAHGALRGGAGVLISAHAQPNAQGAFLDSRSAQQQTQQAKELVENLAQSAQTQKAQLKGELAPDKLPIVEGLAHIAKVLGTTEEGTGSANLDTAKTGHDTSPGNARANPAPSPIKATGGGYGTVIAWSEPHLQISAPMGISATTPKEAVFVSGTTSTLVAQEDLGFHAQGQIAIAVAKGAVLYTVGAKAAGDEPNQERGIMLHAATGAVNVQSQGGKSTLAADKQVSIVSTQKSVTLQAPEHLLLTVAGAYIKLSGKDIQIHAPGKVTFRATQHVFTGPVSVKAEGKLNPGPLAECEWKS